VLSSWLGKFHLYLSINPLCRRLLTVIPAAIWAL
jgi:hypothetical protein